MALPLVAGLMLLVIGAVLAAVAWPPMELRRARAVSTDRGCVEGAYLSASAQGVQLASGKADQLLIVPASEIRSITLLEKSPLKDQTIDRSPAGCP